MLSSFLPVLATSCLIGTYAVIKEHVLFQTEVTDICTWKAYLALIGLLLLNLKPMLRTMLQEGDGTPHLGTVSDTATAGTSHQKIFDAGTPHHGNIAAGNPYLETATAGRTFKPKGV